MCKEESVELFQRCVAGDPDAQFDLYNRFVRRLTSLCRTRIASHLKSRIGPEDVVQSAYRSFFRRTQAGEFRIEQTGDLWKLLTVLVLRKTLKQIEFHHARKRDARMEITISGAESDIEFLLHQPTDDDADLLVDEVRTLLAPLDERDRRIMELRLQDMSTEEIAEVVELCPRTIRRTLSRLYNQLSETLGA